MNRMQRWVALSVCLAPLFLAPPCRAQIPAPGDPNTPFSQAPMLSAGDVKALIGWIADENEAVEDRIRFIDQLRPLGPRPEEAAPVLLRLLTNGQEYRSKKGHLITNDGGLFVQLYPEKIGQTSYPDLTWEFRRAIVQALEAMGPDVVPQTVRAYATLLAQLGNQRLTNYDPETINPIFSRLAAEGPRAKVAVPTLIGLVQNDHPYWVTSAMYALGKTGDPRARDVLNRVRLRSSYDTYREAAARALRDLDAAPAR